MWRGVTGGPARPPAALQRDGAASGADLAVVRAGETDGAEQAGETDGDGGAARLAERLRRRGRRGHGVLRTGRAGASGGGCGDLAQGRTGRGAEGGSPEVARRGG